MISLLSSGWTALLVSHPPVSLNYGKPDGSIVPNSTFRHKLLHSLIQFNLDLSIGVVFEACFNVSLWFPLLSV